MSENKPWINEHRIAQIKAAAQALSETSDPQEAMLKHDYYMLTPDQRHEQREQIRQHHKDATLGGVQSQLSFPISGLYGDQDLQRAQSQLDFPIGGGVTTPKP